MNATKTNEDIKSMHIAVYALSLLGGTHTKVHTEDIANKCMEVAPSRFRWERYDYPDKELVRKALVHAGEKKNGSLVTGRSGMEQRGKSRDGWQLTPAGAEWLRKNESILQKGLTNTSTVIPKREAQRFLSKIRSEPVFHMFVAKRNLSGVSRYMFTDLLNCSPDAPIETIKIKFNRLLSIAELVNDREVLEFLASCKAQFAALLVPSTKAIGGKS
jgi:hypothetical protein